jgi:undecaprenyl-diphosphatase
MMDADLNVKLFQWIHSGAGVQPFTDGFAIFAGEGGPWFLAALFLIIWFFVGENKKITLLEATQAAITGLLINQLIGLFYFHPRPYMMGLCTPLIPHSPETSFPSDHGTLMFAAAFYLSASKGFKSLGIPLLVITFFTVWGRVYSGIHFPLDIAGSIIVSLASVSIIYGISAYISNFNKKIIGIIDQVVGVITNKGRKKMIDFLGYSDQKIPENSVSNSDKTDTPKFYR